MARTTMFLPRPDGGIRLVVPASEAPMLAGLLDQLAELVAPQQPTDPDPLVAMLGIGTATEVPDDPVLARLFPNAYPDDPEAAGEFRRYTEIGLRDQKYQRAVLARATLADTDSHSDSARDLTEAETLAWLGSLNDIRLALGTRLGVTDDDPDQFEDLTDDDPAWVSHFVYDWLGGLQELLVRCLSGALDDAD